MCYYAIYKSTKELEEEARYQEIAARNKLKYGV